MQKILILIYQSIICYNIVKIILRHQGWNKDEVNDFSNENNDANNYRIKQQQVNLLSIRQK